VFVQVIQGQVTDAQPVRQLLDQWMERLSPGAEGWLGSTAGVTEDGTFVAAARFESAEAAERNSARAQQGEWWSAVSKLFDGAPEFHNCSEVDVARGGGSDQAGFVQVIQGRAVNLPRLRELAGDFERRFPDVRPDLLGFLVAYHDGEDGAFTQVAYFVSEEEARLSERQEPPPEVAEALREEMALIQDARYYDLRRPWMDSPR
jgi:hypothetical protein